MSSLHNIAKQLVSNGKGILAADESTASAAKRLSGIGMENTEENRRAMRDMLLTTEGLENYVSGVIFYDETFRQQALDGRLFRDVLASKGMLSGIKVDMGLEDFAEGASGEQVTLGLDTLAARLKEYASLGATFAKWRAVYMSSDSTPTAELLAENAKRLAKYAKLCQEAGIVPMVEPEVLMDNAGATYSQETSFAVGSRVLASVFGALAAEGVDLKGIILKPSMVIQGASCASKATAQQVADQTVRCLLENVPASVGGVAFLSGGQSDEEATLHLSLMNQHKNLPWALTFSYGRALQHAALKAWGGKDVKAGQAQMLHRAVCNSLAAQGQYSSASEASLLAG